MWLKKNKIDCIVLAGVYEDPVIIFAIIRDENKRCINLLLKYKKDFGSNLNSVLKIMWNYTANESSWEKAELLWIVCDKILSTFQK